jgi:hypothetical protein
MAKDAITKLKIALGTFELEFEGSEAFLQVEVPKFVHAARDLQVSQVNNTVNNLQTRLEESHSTSADIDKLIEETKQHLNSLSEMGEMESLRMQMAMDRLSKLMSTLSNLLKKASEASADIVRNLK